MGQSHQEEQLLCLQKYWQSPNTHTKKRWWHLKSKPFLRNLTEERACTQSILQVVEEVLSQEICRLICLQPNLNNSGSRCTMSTWMKCTSLIHDRLVFHTHNILYGKIKISGCVSLTFHRDLIEPEILASQSIIAPNIYNLKHTETNLYC